MEEEIWKIKIKLCKAYKICEIKSTMVLSKLCPFMLDIFDFDHDHLHKFYLGKNTSQPYGANILEVRAHKETTTKIRDVLPNDNKLYLFMLFDFGDEWVFRVSKERTACIFNPQTKYPKIIKEVGQNPEQYPEYEED